MGGYVSHETRTSVRYFLGAILLPHLIKIRIPTHTLSPTHHLQIAQPRYLQGEGEVLIIPLGNTLYNHPPLPNNHIVSYIYTNYHPPPTTINHNYKSSYKYHTPTLKPPKNNRTLYRITY